MALVQARVSDFSHKSMNASEDSKIFYNPASCERADALTEWYQKIVESGAEKEDFHPLSGNF